MWIARDSGYPHHEIAEGEMTFQRIPFCVEVHINARQDNIPVVNRVYVDTGATVTESIMDAVFDVFDAWITASLAPQMTNHMAFESVSVKNMDVINGQLKIYTPATTTGGRSATAAINSAASCISLRTAFSGKNFRGRFYLGGLCQSDFTSSTQIGTAVVTSHADIMTDLIDALTTATYGLAVVSKFLNGIARAVALVTQVSSVVVNTIVDNQRRRTAN